MFGLTFLQALGMIATIVGIIGAISTPIWKHYLTQRAKNEEQDRATAKQDKELAILKGSLQSFMGEVRTGILGIGETLKLLEVNHFKHTERDINEMKGQMGELKGELKTVSSLLLQFLSKK